MRIRFPLPFGAREQRQALFCASLLFFVVSGFIILKSVRDAYFLSLYSSRSLPYFMALNTAVSAVTAAIYLRIYRKYVLSRVVRASLAVFSFGTFLFYLLIDPTHHATIGLLYIWVGIFGTIAPVQAWALVIQQISTRQARRAMGIIGAGAIFGSVGGGFVARLVTGPYGVDALLPFAALAIAIALIFSVPLAAVREEHEQTQLSLAEDHSRRRKRFVIMMLLLVATGTVVSAFIDFQFKTLSQQRYVTARSLAEFFGSFYAYLGASTMVFQLVATPLLMRRFGVAGTLTVLPLFLLIENGLVFVLGLFGAAVLMRGSEELLRHSVDRSSLEVLYAALPEKTRIRIKSLIDTIGVRVPEGIAALVLVALFSVGRAEMSLLFVVNAVLLATWILLAYLLGRREYPGVLREEI